jgi:acetyl esterase/lipase
MVDKINFEDAVLEELLPGLRNAPVIDIAGHLHEARELPVCPFIHSADVTTKEYRVHTHTAEILLRLYRPAGCDDAVLPVIVWMHGGGYVLGSIETEDGFCEQIVTGTDSAVASVGYRLAPEYKYPAAIEDCYTALEWISTNTDTLNLDRNRIAIGGVSGGGGLTAALAIMARDRKGPHVMFQMPLYPMVDDRNETQSSREFTMTTMPHAWNRENNIAAWHMYLGDMKREDVPCYAAPARASDLSCLPPAYICIGTLDPFRDEVLEYAGRMLKCGVPVEFHLYPGCYHGFDAYCNTTKISRRARTEYLAALKNAFYKN